MLGQGLATWAWSPAADLGSFQTRTDPAAGAPAGVGGGGRSEPLRQPAASVPSSHSLVATKGSPGSQQLCKVHWGGLPRAAGPFQSQIRGKEGRGEGRGKVGERSG